MMVVNLAVRNLRRYLRRTLLTLTGIALGMALAMMAIGLGDGGHDMMIENGLALGQGHITIQPQNYLQSPSTGLFLTDVSGLNDIIRSEPEIEISYPRIRGDGMLSSAAGGEGIAFVGIDPGIGGEGKIIQRSMVEGEFPNSSEGNWIVIGRKLAKLLNLKVGRKTVLTVQDSAGEITSALFRVKGIFYSGSPEIDRVYTIMPLKTLQEILGMGNGVTSIAVYLGEHRETKAVLKRLRKTIPDERIDVLPWQKVQSELRDFVVLDDAFGYLYYLIIMIIVSIGVLNTVLMSVMDRKREIGILMAVGMKPGSVLRMILMETSLIAILGTIAGFILGYGIHFYFATQGLNLESFMGDISLAGTVIDPVYYSKMRPARILQICTVVILMTVSMGIYPAVKASKTEPVEAMEKP
ncbi:MAG: FtsX-like permease family protein [bacterium]